MRGRAPRAQRPQKGRFWGREAELGAVAEALDQASLVSLVGPPGIGKSRLAERSVEGRAACVCDLGDAQTEGDVARALAGALGMAPERGHDASSIERILAASGPGIVVLDNADRVTEHVGRMVDAWLRAAPGVRVVITSRERLDVTDARVIVVGSLDVPASEAEAGDCSAVRLFVDRARAVRRGYTLVGREAARVAELVQKLDGNPLAIELAAARLRVLGTAELCASLPRDLDAFSENNADAPRHQRTLRCAVAWSWDRLAPWEQTALSQCSVFQGPFDARAACGVIDLCAHAASPPALEVIQALCDRSLVVTDRGQSAVEQGYLRLPIGVFLFAREKLREQGGAESAEARRDRSAPAIGAPIAGSQAAESDAPRPLREGSLRVSLAGNWFELSGGARVSAPAKPCRVLRSLADQQRRAPGTPRSIGALLEDGWPGEKMHPDAGAKRVHTAIWHLRRLGLKDVILRVDGGYLLDPSLAVD